MKQHAARYVAWLRRWLWGLWPGRNPLRRRCDCAEAVILSGLVAACVIGGPLAAVGAGRWAHDGAASATLAILALVVVLGEAGLCARYLVDRHRLAAWDAEWRAMGPKWSHHG